MISSFLIPFILSLVSVPIFGYIAKKLNIVDKPDNYLKPHGKATPYLGGLGIYVGLLPILWKSTAILLPASFLLTIGLTDDIFSLSPKLRLLIEFISAALIIIAFHIRGIWMILYIFGIVAMINAVNMIDGMDGICGGNVAISSLFFFIISQDPFTKELSLAVLGASLGYLIYNFPPARIFMGDAGSYLLGVSLAILYTLSSRPIPSTKMLVSIFPLWIYILDLIAGVVRRLRNRRNPFEGDRDHIYDKLKRRIGSTRKVVICTYIINAAFSALVFLSPFVGMVLAILFSVALIRLLNMFGYDQQT